MNKVLDVASYVLDRCTKKGAPISNLELQKVLYFAQGKFLAKYGKPIFDDDYFVAWRFGPVVPSVYYKYNINIARPIKEVFSAKLNLSVEEQNMFNQVVDEYSRYNAWDLVDKSHETKPWKDSYDKGLSFPISNESMLRYFHDNCQGVGSKNG